MDLKDILTVLMNAIILGMFVSLFASFIRASQKIWTEASNNVDQRMLEKHGPIFFELETVESKSGIVYLIYDKNHNFIGQDTSEDSAINMLIKKYPNRSIIFERVYSNAKPTAS